MWLSGEGVVVVSLLPLVEFDLSIVSTPICINKGEEINEA